VYLGTAPHTVSYVGTPDHTHATYWRPFNIKQINKEITNSLVITTVHTLFSHSCSP